MSPNPTSHPCPIEFGNLIAGRYFCATGYVRLRLSDGRVIEEHRLVMETVLGRSLHPWEMVRHLNGDRADNRPANLMLAARGLAPGQRKDVAKIELVCSCCRIGFSRRAVEVNLALKRGKTHFYCSRRCVGKSFGRAKQGSENA